MRLGVFVIVAILTSAACGARNTPPPVRNPLAETGTAAVASPTALATVLPTATATGPAATAPPTPAEVEPAVARATALMAEWLAVSQRDLALVSAEAVAWPNACLGVEQPGLLCAQVITPGFRVRLRDGPGATHEVHLDAGAGNARWAGEFGESGIITEIDRTAGRLTIAVGGKAALFRLVPGTQFVPDAAHAARLGVNVKVAYDGGGTAAWIAAVP